MFFFNLFVQRTYLWRTSLWYFYQWYTFLSIPRNIVELLLFEFFKGLNLINESIPHNLILSTLFSSIPTLNFDRYITLGWAEHFESMSVEERNEIFFYKSVEISPFKCVLKSWGWWWYGPKLIISVSCGFGLLHENPIEEEKRRLEIENEKNGVVSFFFSGTVIGTSKLSVLVRFDNLTMEHGSISKKE